MHCLSYVKHCFFSWLLHIIVTCQHISLFSFPLAFQELGSNLHICSCSHPAKVKGHCMNHLYAGKKSIHAAHWAPYGTGLIDFRRAVTEKTLKFRVWSHLIRKFSFLGALATWDPSSFSWKKQISLEGNVHLWRLCFPFGEEHLCALTTGVAWWSPHSNLTTSEKCLLWILPPHGLEVPLTIEGPKLGPGQVPKKVSSLFSGEELEKAIIL